MTGYHPDIEKLAYKFWEERGRPFGSPEVDWFQAEKEIEQAARAWDLSETTSESESYTTSEARFDNEGGHISEEETVLSKSQGRGRSRGRALQQVSE